MYTLAATPVRLADKNCDTNVITLYVGNCVLFVYRIREQIPIKYYFPFHTWAVLKHDAVVQIAYTFIVILCQEWNKAITRKYQPILL